MQGTTHLNLNSGFFYLRANERTIDLMKRIAARLAKEKAWDQVGQSILERVFMLPDDDCALILTDFSRVLQALAPPLALELSRVKDSPIARLMVTKLRPHMKGMVWQALVVCVAAVCVQ